MRPRIRSLKPDVWQSEQVARLSRDARLLFIALVTFADDQGRWKAHPALLRAHAYPYDDVTLEEVEGWLSEVAGAGLVDLYEVGGTRFGSFPTWARHQKVSRPKPSDIPARCGTDSLIDHGSISDRSPQPHGSISDPSLQARGSITDGREGIRREVDMDMDTEGTGSRTRPGHRLAAIVEAWNEIAVPAGCLPARIDDRGDVLTSTAELVTLDVEREVLLRPDRGVDWWRGHVQRIARSSWCRGVVDHPSCRPWGLRKALEPAEVGRVERGERDDFSTTGGVRRKTVAERLEERAEAAEAEADALEGVQDGSESRIMLVAPPGGGPLAIVA